jgi:hypothetical protein
MLVTTLDAVAGILAAIYMFRLRQRFGLYLAMFILASAVEATIARITMGMLPFTGTAPLWFVLPRFVGRCFKASASAMLALYLLGYVNGRWAKRIGR